MQIFLAPILVTLTALVFAGTRATPSRPRLVWRLLTCALVLLVAVGATLLLSRRSSGALRLDLLPFIPLLYTAFLAELWLINAAFERMAPKESARTVQILVTAAGALMLNFFTMVVLVVIMPS